MKEVILADETAYTKAFAYDVKKFPLLTEGETVLITNAIKKENGNIIMTSKTDVFTTTSSMVVVPESVRNEATQEKTQKTSSILDASLSPKKTVLSVQGKVVKTTSVCRKRLSTGEGEVSLKKLKVKDNTGVIEVGLWREMAETDVKPGDHVQLNNFYVSSRFYTEKKTHLPVLANQKRNSSSHNSSLQFVTVDNDELSSDCSDFEDDDASKITGNLIGIQQLSTYKACINTRCNMKKLNPDNKCSICAVQYSNSSAGRGYVAKILVEAKAKFHVFTFFTQAMKTLLKSLEITDYANLSKDLKDRLPLKIEYTADGDKIKTLEALNKAEVETVHT